MLKKIYAAFAVSLLFVAAGCAQLGLAAPETFNQKLAVGYATVTQVRETATSLLVAQKIGSKDAENVQASADVARVGLDTARTMAAVDPTAANAKVDAIRTGLTALSAYLASRQK